MARLRRVRYKLEAFSHPHDSPEMGQRQRQLFAVALFGQSEMSMTGLTMNLAPRNNDALKHSLSTCFGRGPNDADIRTSNGEIQDLFLDGLDHGHLIGKQLGGSDRPYNLAPMGSSHNRGGDWAQIESAIAKAKYAVLAVCLTYNNHDDGRIPVTVSAAACDITQGQFTDLDAPGAFDVLITSIDGSLCAATSGNAVKQALMQLFNAWSIQAAQRQPVYQQLMPPPLPSVPKSYLTASITQSGMYYRPLYYAINRPLLTQLMVDGIPNGWYVEEDPRFPYHAAGYVHPQTGDSLWTATYGLAPRSFRPYAFLDWLAMEGRLHQVFLHPTLGKDDFDLAKVGRQEDTYPSHYVAAILMMNRIKYSFVARGQDLYVSDYGKTDLGGLKEGVTLCPQIDHIVPRNPELGYSVGLTLFSNAAVASASYNNLKKNKMLYTPVVVGTVTTNPSVSSNLTRTRKVVNYALMDGSGDNSDDDDYF